MKFLFEYITNSFTLIDNPLDDYVLMAIIGGVSFAIAYMLVGKLYGNKVISGRGIGHILHWVIRLIVFVVVFYIAAAMIRVYTWFAALPDYKWWIIGFIIGIVVIGKITYEVLQNKRTYR